MHLHRRSTTGWQIRHGEDGSGATIELGGLVRAPGSADPVPVTAHHQLPGAGHGVASSLHTGIARPRVIGPDPLVFELSAAHYRRSEPTWEEAGRPHATVALARTGDLLLIDVAMTTPAPVFVPSDAINELDNEHPDINGDGVQLHLHVASEGFRSYLAAWIAIPESQGGVRVREIAGSGAGWLPGAEWQPTSTGYTLRLLVPRSHLAGNGRHPFSLDVLVNESAPGRARRRGQLVLSGARGEWVYLRGDRHAPARHLAFIIDDA